MCGSGTASVAGNPSPRRRGPAEPARSLAPSLRGGEGKEEEGGRHWESESREKEAGCAGRRRRGNRSLVPGRSPRQLQVESAKVADSAAASAATSSPGCLPGPEGGGVGAPGARPSRVCASAPRPWLRAGGGRRKRKSCGSWGAGPGAERSRATRPQVRGSGSAKAGGTQLEGGPPGGPTGPAPEVSSTLTSMEPAPLGGERESGISILILTFGRSRRKSTLVSAC